MQNNKVKIPCKNIVYISRYYVHDGLVVKAYNSNIVTPELIEELKRNYADITIQNGKEIKMYFSREGMERLNPSIFSNIPKDYDITIYVGNK